MSPSRLFTLSLTTALLLGCQSQATDETSSDYRRAESFTEGVPGGTVVEVEEMQALVTAVAPDTRSFTLMDRTGSKRTFQAPSEMRNFDQLEVGDRVTARVMLERIVYLREPGEAAREGAAGLLATAPDSSKPGMLAADTVQLTAVVKGMDTTLRTATLQFADGSERVVKVRPDVEMKTEYLGRAVVLRMTSAVAISVERQ